MSWHRIVLGIGKPLPRAGVFAHGQAHAVADTIAHAITGTGEAGRFDRAVVGHEHGAHDAVQRPDGSVMQYASTQNGDGFT